MGGIWFLRAHFVVCRFTRVRQLFPVFWTTSFKRFYKASFSHAHTCLLRNMRFYIFSCFWSMTCSEIEQFVLESWLVLFVVDNCRLHHFLHKKTLRKSWFFCVSLLPSWIPSKRQLIFKFFVIPGSLLRPPDVRIWHEITIKSACFWNAQKLL